MIRRTGISAILAGEFTGSEVCVFGWVKTSRSGKNVGFASLNDGSSVRNLQVVFDRKVFSDSDLSGLLAGACVRVSGTVVPSSGEQAVELTASSLSIIGPVDDGYPLQKKRHGLDFLRSLPHLRSRTNTFGAVFRMSHHLSMAIHRFFDSEGFYYLHTPVITESDCEGAGETFRVTTLPPGVTDPSLDYFRRPAFLSVSGQLEAEPFALSLGKVYTFGPTFRADPSDTRTHVAEFRMIEPEMAFFDLDDDVALIERFVKYCASYLASRCPEDIAFFSEHYENGLPERYRLLEKAFARVSYTEAMEILSASSSKLSSVPAWGDDLATEHERFLAEVHFGGPVFVTDYPASMKPFYMHLNSDGKTVAACDLLVPGVGEIVGGSQREHRLDILRERAVCQGLDMEVYRWYLELRRWGSAPHAGFGLGFERLLMYLTGMENIRDVIPFPRAFGKMY
jgi:asparaginyl-tRNA synthetase